MTRKQIINIEVPAEVRDEFQQAAASAQQSSSELLRRGIYALDRKPQLLANTVAEALKEPEPEPRPRVKTSLTLDDRDISIVDTLARKLISSRNAIIQLIIKGVLSGIVKP